MGSRVSKDSNDFSEELMEAAIISADIDIDEMEEIGHTDARRRLEDKLEEIRLKKEMREFDFDD